jgi:hypothetical protein
MLAWTQLIVNNLVSNKIGIVSSELFFGEQKFSENDKRKSGFSILARKAAAVKLLFFLFHF